MKETKTISKFKKFKHGQALVFMVFFMLASLVLAGFAVDIGALAFTRQRMRKAADAAALAGIMEMSQTIAREYTALNGYEHGVDGVTVVAEINPTYPLEDHPNWFRVTITAPFNFFFGRIIGLIQRDISVFATAQYNAYVPISINMSGNYGDDFPDVTLMIRGPDSPYHFGDPISALEKDGMANPDYDPEGYSYWLYVPDNYDNDGNSNLRVDIWDADSYGNYDSTGTDCETYFSLYAPDDTPQDYSDDVLIATFHPDNTATWVRTGRWSGYWEAPETNDAWYTPDGFEFDYNLYGAGRYRLQVETEAGYNANGFSLRAGKGGETFDPDNGTKIMAVGSLPVRFNNDGNVTICLGYVPADAAGTNMHINKFDTDIGDNRQVTYTCDAISGSSWQGELAGEGEWAEDVLTIPDSYSGGLWYATYYADTTDCSMWSMWYEGMGEEGFAFLVQ